MTIEELITACKSTAPIGLGADLIAKLEELQLKDDLVSTLVGLNNIGMMTAGTFKEFAKAYALAGSSQSSHG